MRRGGHTLAALAAGVAVAALPAPALAGEVLVVDGSQALRRDDPLVPARAVSDLPSPPPSGTAPPVAAAASRQGERAVERALRTAVRSRRLGAGRGRALTRAYRHALALARRLPARRAVELRYVVGALERLALSGRLIPSRIPVAFAQLERNARYWPRLPFPAAGDRVSFRGSEVLYQYFPGRGLQLHPLGTFIKANLIHSACVKRDARCRPAALAGLLDEMSRYAAWRGRSFVAWEYAFYFGGGSPPWMSGMAQATAIQALARAGGLLGRPRYVDLARAALGAFETPPPLGVRTRGPHGGIHYLQYSFASRLFIFNAFTQSLLRLRDFAQLTGDPRAGGLFSLAEPELRRELPDSDTGSWSRYSYRGRASTPEYHELLREVLQGMCDRRVADVYCDYATRYRSYQERRASAARP